MSDVAIFERVDEIGRVFEEFRETHERELREIKRNGAPDPLTTDKLVKLNGRLDRLETVANRSPRASSGGEEKSEEHKAFEDFLRFGAVSPLLQSAQALEGKVLSLGDQQAAGYLAPSEYIEEILKGVTEFSPVRSVARVLRTNRTSIEIPKRSGVFTAEWVAELGTRSETTGLEYGLEEIPTHEMFALVDVSAQLVEDSAFDMDTELNTEASERFGVLEGAAFITGNAAGKPEGILDNTAVATTNSGSATTVADADGTADGLISLYHALKTEYARRATWLLNRTVLGSIRKLKDAGDDYIWQPGVAGSLPPTILGQPYVEAPDMPDEAAAATPVIFGDYRRGYIIVDRVSMSVLRDPFTQATTGKIRYIFRRRVGGQVVIAEAMRKLVCAV